jgi:hypothetical protein
MAGETVAVRGLTELIRDFKNLDKPTARRLRESLRHAGDVVKDDAAARFSRYSSKSAAGYRTRVRQRGVAVAQTLRKTTGTHPEFGALQMRKALLPALYAHEADLERDLERALDQISREFEARGV